MSTPSCARDCRIAGAVLGLLVWIMTAGAGSLAWFEGLLLGVITAVLMGALLRWLVCDGAPPVWEAGMAARPAEVFSPAPLGAAQPVGGPLNMAPSEVQPAAPTDATPFAEAPERVADPAPLSPVLPVAGPEPSPALVPTPETIAVAVDWPDDLKAIRGIGPKIESLLHDHGVTRFAEIAAWSDADVDRLAALIGPLGHRIRSEDWRGQAAALDRHA